MSKVLCAPAHGVSPLLYRLGAKMQGSFSAPPDIPQIADKPGNPRKREGRVSCAIQINRFSECFEVLKNALSLSKRLFDKLRAARSGGSQVLQGDAYFAALAALMASISMGVTLNRSPQMP